MKKILAFILLFSLSFALISCGGDDEEVYNWRGDWNDSKDENYKPEGYNPIEGIWKSGGKGFYFSDKFRMHIAEFRSDGSYTIAPFTDIYMINDEAFQLKGNSQIFRYVLSGDVLKMTSSLLEDKDWVTYTRFVPTETEK